MNGEGLVLEGIWGGSTCSFLVARKDCFAAHVTITSWSNVSNVAGIVRVRRLPSRDCSGVFSSGNALLAALRTKVCSFSRRRRVLSTVSVAN